MLKKNEILQTTMNEDACCVSKPIYFTYFFANILSIQRCVLPLGNRLSTAGQVMLACVTQLQQISASLVLFQRLNKGTDDLVAT